jgi:predicted transcriptional regulator
MSTISVRIPDSLHRRIKDLSKKEHVSMNQLIALAVAEKVSVLEAEDYLVPVRKGPNLVFEV